jgi:esterase/lipase superfamily enzyme
MSGHRVILLVHGCNTTLAAAAQSFRRIAGNLSRRAPDAYDTVDGFTWPAGNSPYT